MSQIKLCIAGKNNIAVDVLDYVIRNNIYAKDEVVVVCNRTETGENTWQKSLRYFAKMWGIREVALEEVYQIEDICMLSLEFDRIIRPELFKTQHLYNIHFSKLPKYKGCYTAIMPILNGEKESGVTFHRMNSGIDTGDIIDQVIFPIDDDDTARDLYFKCLFHGTRLVIKQLLRLKDSKVVVSGYGQGADGASYYSKNAIDFANLVIDTKKTAFEVCAQLRAFSFREYQMPKVNGKDVAKAEIIKMPSQKKPGTIVWQDTWRGIISTIDYDVVLYWDVFDIVMKASANGDVETLQKVPNLDYYVNQAGNHGWTPLIVAAYHGHYDVFMLLASKGADLQQRNWHGTNLLMYAKDGWRRTHDGRIITYLCQRGVSIDEKDYVGKKLEDYCTKEEYESLKKLCR